MNRKNFGPLVFILSTSVLLILLVFNTVMVVSAATLDNYPGKIVAENRENIQGGTFTLHHRFTYNQPAGGFYNISVWWEYVNPDTGLPDNNYNFTLDNYVAYCDNGQGVECTMTFDMDNGSLHSQVFANENPDPNNYTFNVDIRYSLKGPDGTLHIVTDNHPFHYTSIMYAEAIILYAYPDDVTIKVDPITRSVDVSVSPPTLKTGWSGDNLSYDVTVTNTGNATDNFDLTLSEALGWPHGWDPIENLRPTHDAQVRELYPTTNYGNQYNMYVGTENMPGTTRERDFLKFSLASIPAGATINSATLSLMSRYGPSHPPGNIDDNIWVEVMSVSDDTWTELGITWNNQPAMGAMLDNEYFIGDNWAGQYARYYWDVTSFVQSEFAGDKVVSFGIMSQTEEATPENNSGWFYQKDGGNLDNRQPWLEIDWTPKQTGEIAAGDNWTGCIWVVVSGAGCTTDNLTVTATSMENENVENSATCYAHSAVARVDVTIDPPSKSGMGDTTFTVTVTNTGDLPDNYTLENSDNSGWELLLDNVVLGPIENGENMTTTLHVDIPFSPGTTDNITVKATSIHDNTVSDNATCQAISQVRGVQVIIDPSPPAYLENENGRQVIFTVTVKNTGEVQENFQLENGDNAGWTLNLDNNWLLVDNGDNKTTKLTVSIPASATGCTYDNIWVQAASKDFPSILDNKSCLAHVKIVSGVSVSISPSPPAYLENENGRSVTFTVTVNNTGNVPENFQLTKGDNAVWELSLADNWLLVSKGGTGTTNLTVNIPSNATGGTWDNITVKATSQDNTEVFDNKSCLAHAKIVRGVQVVIDPSPPNYLENENGGTVKFTVTVVNLGNVQENFQLTKGDNAGWTLDLDNNWLLVPKNDNRTTNLTVNIPPKAIGCTWDNIWVQATSQADPTVLDNKSCLAHVKVVRVVDVSISPKSIYGALGGIVVFTVTVKNTGNAMDNYILENKADNMNWPMVLSDNIVDNRVENVGPYDNYKLVKLTVTIPSDATPGTSNSIMVTATSQNDAAVKDNDNCQAFAGAVELRDENDNFVNGYTEIQPAIDNAKPKYTVIVYPGTFTENLTVDVENLTIRSWGGPGVTIIDAGGAENGVKIVASGVTFGGFTVTNGGLGIQLWYSNNNLIENNITENNTWVGIELYFSDNNRIENNIAENNDYGIELGYSDINIVSNNTASNNTYGIYLWDSYNNLIENNTAWNNVYGINIRYSSNNNIAKNNTASNNTYGFYIYESDNNRIENNNVWDSIGGSGIYLYDSYNNRIENNNVWDSSANGIRLDSSNNNTLENNTCSNNYYGIYLYYSNNNILDNNTLTGNGYGFYVYYSNNNQIDNNTILATTYSNYGSCPFLYTWNGTEMKFIGDINGPGTLGQGSMSGRLRRPTSTDYTAIDGSDLVPKDGSYKLEVAEDSDEITYFDNAELWVIDHAPGVEIYSHEAALNTITPYLYPPVIHTVRNPVSPVSATDWNGNDVLPVIASPDGVYTQPNPPTDSYITLDLGDLSGATQIKLIYRAYIDWSFKSDVKGNVYVETKNASGEWEKVSDFGRPEGEPRTFVIDITDWFKTNDWHLRIHTGKYKIHVDWIAVDTSVDEPVTVTVLKPTSANLYYKGPDNPGFEYFFGNFTKYGDVLPLLQNADDEFVIMRAGDSVELKFAEQPAPAGERDFMLVSDAYFKEPFVKNLLGNDVSTVDPLPFHGMSNYPYPSSESYPSDAEHLAYLSEWNTRGYSGGEGAGISLPYSDNNTVFGNTIIGNSSSTGLSLDHETNTRILNNTISNTYDGIYLLYSVNCIVDNNIVENNSNNGIYLQYSNNNRIENNTCENNGNFGIYLSYSDNNHIENNTCSNNGGDGIHLEYSDNITISNNTCDNNYWWGIYLGDSSNNTLKKNNCSDNNNHGIFLNSSSNNTVDNNTCENNRGDGIHLEYSDINTISNNNCNNNYYWGIMLNSSENDNLTNNTCENNSIGIYVYGDINGNNKVIMRGNTIEKNSSYGIYFDGSDICDNSRVEITGNTIDNNNHYGIFFNDYIFDNSRVEITGNTINNNGWEGLEFEYEIYGNSIVQIENNSISNNGEEGIFFNDDIYGNSLVQIENNSISNNDDAGIYFYEYIYDNSEVVIIGNTIDNNGSYGIYFEEDIEDNSNVRIENNSISNNDDEGIYFYYYIEDDSVVMIIGNTIDNNDSYGIYFDDDIYDNSIVWIENNSVHNNGEEGINFEYDIYGNSRVMITGNTIDYNYWYGIDLDGDIYGNSIVWIENNYIHNNDDEGIDIDGDIYENSKVGIIGNRIENNGSYGIDFDGAEIYDNSFFMIGNNSISNNDEDGIYFYCETYGNSVVWIDNNSISNNGESEYYSGIYFDDSIYENSMVGITRNTINNNGHGIYISDDIEAPVIIAFNQITNNEFVDSGVHLDSGVDSRGLMVSFNNIMGNSPSAGIYGVYNGNTENNLNALYNWWGDASGPSGVGLGTGDNVGENVDYRPWIPSPFEDVVIGSGGDYISEGHNEIEPVLEDLDWAPIPESVIVTLDSSENGLLMVTMFEDIGGAPIPGGLVTAMFIDISAIPKNTAENIKITVHYTDGDVSGIDESSLKLYYWSSDDNSWHLCDNISVNASANTISGTIDHLTPFGIFGAAAAPPPEPTPVPPAAPPVVGVGVSISPSVKSGLPGSSLSYTVTVMNTGENTDTFALVISGGAGWLPDISPTLLTLAPSVSGTAILTVIVPSNATGGDSTTIHVTATSLADPTVSSTASCRATASAPAPSPGPTPSPTGVSGVDLLVIGGSILAIILLLLFILFGAYRRRRRRQ